LAAVGAFRVVPEQDLDIDDLTPSESVDERVVSLTFASWNQLGAWLPKVELQHDSHEGGYRLSGFHRRREPKLGRRLQRFSVEAEVVRVE
jgi:hypothetical protein